MAIVVSQPFKTAGRGSRKLCITDKGHYFAVVSTGVSSEELKVYKSTDEGSNWSLFKTFDRRSLLDCSITSIGDYIIIASNKGTVDLVCSVIHSETAVVHSEYSLVDKQKIDSVSLSVDKARNILHVVWGSPRSSGTTVLNVHHTKGLFDRTTGALTWDVTPKSVTTSAGADYKNPVVVTKSNGNPVIFYQQNEGRRAIYMTEYSLIDNSWSPERKLFEGGIYATNDRPSACIDANDTIHVVWTSGNSNPLEPQVVKYSKSDNGGQTWSNELTLSNVNSYTLRQPSISCDKNNKVVVVYGGVTAESTPNIYNIYQRTLENGSWSGQKPVTNITSKQPSVSFNVDSPSVLLDESLVGEFGEIPPLIYTDNDNGVVKFVGSYEINNSPTIHLDTANGSTPYENDNLSVSGVANDLDDGDIVNIKYQINSRSVRNLHSAVSDGVTPIEFLKTIKYSEGILKDGNTAITSVLSKDQPHTISVWAEDDNGGKSEVITRTFYVVPNRPPTLKVDPIVAKSNLINSNVVNVNGSVEDLDSNDVVVTMQINDQDPVEVYTGKSGAWAFNIALKDLRVGANTITIKATDTYDAFTSKVLTIRKTHDAVPVNEAVALYKINPPTRSAQKILLWIERQLGDLAVTAEISMTNDGEPENFVSLPRTNTAPKEGLQEDEFAYQDAAQKTNIILKITYNRTDSAAVAAIKKISGVLS